MQVAPKEATRGTNHEIDWCIRLGGVLLPCIADRGYAAERFQGQRSFQSNEASHAKGAFEIACGLMGRHFPSLDASRQARGRIKSQRRNSPDARRTLLPSHI